MPSAAAPSCPDADAGRRLRLCFVCDEYPPGAHGGIGTCVQVLARALAAAGHAVRVVGAVADRAGAPAYGDDQGVRVWRLPHPDGRFGWVRARQLVWRQVRAWAASDEIDIVEVPDYAGWAAGWGRLPIPVVSRANGSMAFFARELGLRTTRVSRALERASLERSDAWCGASRYVAEATREVFPSLPEASAVLHNPVERPSLHPALMRGTSDIVFSGTLVPKKGVLSLMRAWPAVHAVRPDAVLHMHGKDARRPDGGSMRDGLAALLPEAVRRSVRFHGHVSRDQLFAALATARAAVFPSYAEAFGIAPVEAMIVGCPTIYTRRGPGPEVVRDGVDGLLVEPDSPRDIAEAILTLLSDDALAARLGTAGQRRAHERFSIERLLPANLAFYRAVIARHAGRDVPPFAGSGA